VLLRHRTELLQLLKDLLCKFGQLVILVVLLYASFALLIEVLDKYALDRQLSPIHRVLKHLSQVTEPLFNGHLLCTITLHRQNLLIQLGIHL
jgi:hypothetical protein